jgi:hypothetical protein
MLVVFEIRTSFYYIHELVIILLLQYNIILYMVLYMYDVTWYGYYMLWPDVIW